MKITLDELRELWDDGSIRNEELANRIGVPASYLHVLRLRFGLQRRYHRKQAKDDISVEEIKRRAAEIRKGWSPEERQKRAIGVRRRHWQPPAYDYDHRNAVYTPQ